MDPELRAALDAAVEADPRNAALRVHLAELLAASEQFDEALRHARVVLEQDPANAVALSVASRAARQVHEDVAADGYDQLLQALTGTPQRVEAAGAPDRLDAEIDAFFRNEATENEDWVDVERPKVVLTDVAGMPTVKAQIERSFLGPLANPEIRRVYRKSLRGGMLLYGPPGCGKTFVARAVAGELGAKFHMIGLHDTLDMWMGQSEKNLHDAFERARRNAPCVLFLDEIDALGQKRTNLARSVMRNTVVQLLTELDGLDEVNEGLFVIGATNQPWDVDPALRRPGRFDRAVLVLPPDVDARRQILELHLRGRPVDPQVDLTSIAKVTDQRSGADLNLVCESATEYAIEDSLDSGTVRAITQRDLERAAREVRPSTTSWFEMARNFVMFANTTGQYDDLLAYMRDRRLL
jgi:ATP-dependent 26S proteasome regulatory subunit